MSAAIGAVVGGTLGRRREVCGSLRSDSACALHCMLHRSSLSLAVAVVICCRCRLFFSHRPQTLESRFNQTIPRFGSRLQCLDCPS